MAGVVGRRDAQVEHQDLYHHLEPERPSRRPKPLERRRGRQPGQRVEAFIAAHLDRPLPSVELAREVGLSASRLAHVFRAATGIPVRRYILWCRLRAAVRSALQSRNLTEAAHAAGFADSAHLSRTFRAMFGITPSLLARQTVSVALLP